MQEKETFEGFENFDYRPMIRNQTRDFLIENLKKSQPEKILEIGTFLGYSASVMLETCPQAVLTTVELNPQNAQNALINLKKLGFENRVKVVCSDALDFLKTLGDDQMFDFVFLDGAKGQYIKYLPYLKSHLNAGGVLFADDVLFYGMVTSHEKIAHKHRSIVNHLRDFLQTLQDDNDFETKIYDFDDGVSVSIKYKQI